MPEIRQVPSQLAISAAALTQFKTRFNAFAVAERRRLQEDLSVLAQLKAADDSAVLIQSLEEVTQAGAAAELEQLLALAQG